MPIPQGYPDLLTWFNQPVSDLSQVNSEMAIFQKYWSQFTAAQKTALKTMVINKITENQTVLDEIKTYIQNEV